MDFIVAKISPEAHDELEISHLDKLHNMSRDTAGYNSNSNSVSVNSVRDIEGMQSQDGLYSNWTKKQLNRTGVLTAIAIGLHNIPEGVATYVSAISDLRVGAALAVGVALHNIPEGIAVATPVYFATESRVKAFLWTFISA